MKPASIRITIRQTYRFERKESERFDTVTLKMTRFSPLTVALRYKGNSNSAAVIDAVERSQPPCHRIGLAPIQRFCVMQRKERINRRRLGDQAHRFEAKVPLASCSRKI
jgi:hypothetical protein